MAAGAPSAGRRQQLQQWRHQDGTDVRQRRRVFVPAASAFTASPSLGPSSSNNGSTPAEQSLSPSSVAVNPPASATAAVPTPPAVPDPGLLSAASLAQHLGVLPLQLRMALWALQLLASVVSVVLYVWSTYSPAPIGGARYILDVALACAFAVEFAGRVRARGGMSPLSLVDLLSFLPSLLEAAAQALGVCIDLPDLKWLRILRSLRILRLFLLSGNLPVMKLSTSSLLSGAVNVRLMQLVASVLALIVISASLVHLAERLPWHEALYFVVTSLTTVGYGDVIVRTTFGRLVVLGMICVGVVLIPVRTGQLWSQLVSQRVMAGHELRRGEPFVLLSGRITDVRSFSDLFTEFTAQLQVAAAGKSKPSPQPHLVYLGSRPGNELLAFQDLHDRRLTLAEGSVLRQSDLEKHRAAAASAIMVLANRFSPDGDAEDLEVLFRVWAIKSFTKCVPLTVQVLRASSLAKVEPFLDPANDTITSTQLTRHRLLALSCMCPGASTLLCNLLQTAHTTPDLQASATRGPGDTSPRLAGRTWLAEYVRGCGNEMFVVNAPAVLNGVSWVDAVSAAHQQLHILLIGINVPRAWGEPEGRAAVKQMPGGGPPLRRGLTLNPAQHVISRGEELLVIASSRRHADLLMGLTAQQLEETSAARADVCTEVPWYEATVRWTLDSGSSVDDGSGASLDTDGSASSSNGSSSTTGRGGTGRGSASWQASSCAWPWSPDDESQDLSGLSGHVILSGSQDSFADFARTLRALWGEWKPSDPQWWSPASADDMDYEADEDCSRVLPIVVLHPGVDPVILEQIRDLGPVHEVRGSPANAQALARANAKNARCLVYISSMHRPAASAMQQQQGGDEFDVVSRAALQADSEALLTCYGVGEPSGLLDLAAAAAAAGASADPQLLSASPLRAPVPSSSSSSSASSSSPSTSQPLSSPAVERGPPHTVVELAFTSSVRFLQPGLLLKGTSTYDAVACDHRKGQPRNSYAQRLQAEEAAAAQGLVQYQTNVYFCAGRVIVPAHQDTFICQAFHKKRLLEDFMGELCRDDGGPGGTLLRQLPAPPQYYGRPYRELFQHLVDCHSVLPLGLLRAKAENASWRLDYVSTLPAWQDIVDAGDRVFVLRPGDED